MAFIAGEPRHEGAGRRKGTPNKKTELKDALITVYGGDGVTPFWEGVALESDGTGPMAAACKKMIADRLSPTLKAVELTGDGDSALQVSILRFTPESLKEPDTALEVESTSIVPKLADGLKVVEDQEVTPE